MRGYEWDESRLPKVKFLFIEENAEARRFINEMMKLYMVGRCVDCFFVESFGQALGVLKASINWPYHVIVSCASVKCEGLTAEEFFKFLRNPESAMDNGDSRVRHSGLFGAPRPSLCHNLTLTRIVERMGPGMAGALSQLSRNAIKVMLSSDRNSGNRLCEDELITDYRDRAYFISNMCSLLETYRRIYLRETWSGFDAAVASSASIRESSNIHAVHSLMPAM
ncbi:MAG: hypothetical protein CVV64_12860 [Candidatus Wallbacteria bacterium HGW-Wallbacteria-1]|jgi:hypothetical protein|uniref:Uncharacterized protein n=1 Tax=Candidatus Wallbacteria bacterium HGW-Wallbacteria-1 TaxID=2013854 RepID=A0A2N1PMZ6_9BACT|nr:MAG: hypothetical protein CVV64_12860 [Candidatus Wallbacteria bacterium HGW-Wallbacteria-1]